MILLKRFFTVVIMLLLCPLHTWGDDSRLVPFIGVKEQYNSNILFVTEKQGPQKDFVSIISPGIEMVDRTSRLDTDLLVQLDRLDYSRDSELSATNQAYNGKLAYRATPLLNIVAGAGYSINSNPTLDPGEQGPALKYGTTVIVTTPSNPLNPPASNPPAAVPSNSPNPPPVSVVPVPVVSLPVKHFTASLSADCGLTEKASGMISYNYATDDYKKPAYRDASHAVNAGLVYDLGAYFPLVKARLNAGYNFFDLPDSRTNSITYTVGFSRNFDEVWSISLDGGIRRTWSTVYISQWVQITPDTQQWTRTRYDNHNWGEVASVSLNYRGERSQETLAYVRDLSLASGLNGAAERNAVTFTTQYRLTYEFSAFLTASYGRYKSDSSTYSAQVIDQRTGDVNVGMRYEFSTNASVDVSYDYAMVSYPVADANGRRQIFFISLRAQFPFLE